MVKTRENTRSTKSNTGTKKDKITTPKKTMNGRVHKLRINIKNNIQLNKEDLKQNTIQIQNQTMFSKTRPCNVKVRRTPTNDTFSFYNNNNNTLQAQCKVIEENPQKVDKSIENNTQLFGESVKKINKASENTKMTRNRKKGDKASETFSGHVLKQIKNKTTSKTKEKAKDLHLDNLKSNPAKRILHQKDQPVLLNPFTAKKCTVKLQRILTQNKKENVASVVPLSPSTNKRCIVKLRRTPVTMKTKEIFEKPPTLKITRKSVISIQKSPISKINMENDECTETISCDQQTFSSMLEIDNKKRNNLHKLSLTKSYTKSRKETKENENCENYKETEKILNNSIENSKAIPLKNLQTLTNDNKLINIKHFGKLSLKKPNVQKLTNTTNLESTQLEPEQNSTIYFEPARNSTLLEFGFGIDNKQVKNTNAQDKKTTSPKNLANKSEEIYELLNSLEDDEEIVLKSPDNKNENDYFIENKDGRSGGIKNAISPSNSKIKKFFHRNKKDGENNIFKEPVPIKIKTLVQNQKRCVNKKRSSIARRENVYEFLSQSQTSDSDCAKHSDPTADIVKKLIQQGKVRVATTNKGKGKPKFKRRVQTKQVKIKQTANSKLKQLKKNAKKVPIEENNEEDEHDHFDDDFCNYDELAPDIDNDTQIKKQNIGIKKISNHKNKNHTNCQEGTFSRLAKSVLINQAGCSDMQRKNPSLLLEIVKKIVSTPKNKKMPLTQADLETDLSPIAIPPLRPIAKPSPWRVNEDAYLPRTFNFSRSSGNLPSFSSGFIPSTPRKEKTNKILNTLQQSTMNNERSPIKSNQSIVFSTSPVLTSLQYEQENMQSPTERAYIDNEPSEISFSSNDSNAENVPPPKATLENTLENESIFDLKQLPNPRRALTYRSPLKKINILEVVHFPSYKSPIKKPTTQDTNREIIGLFDDSLQANHSVVSAAVFPPNTAIKNINDCPKEDLFGFEDFLSQTAYSSEENSVTTTNQQNQTMHEKLQNLRKLKPQENELQINVLREKCRSPFKSIHVFDDDDVTKANGMKQGDIKKMLCSTMINQQPSTSKDALKNQKRKNFGDDLDLSELFKDPEPEITFNESDAHRTYIRPYKRKRRLKENNFVMFLDTDESGDENNSPVKQTHEIGHESNSSMEQAPKQKRHRKKHKENPELKKFVEEFNEECKGVDSFELVIEKSA